MKMPEIQKFALFYTTQKIKCLSICLKKSQLVHTISLLNMSHCDTGKERYGGEAQIQLSIEISAYCNLGNYSIWAVHLRKE